MVNKRLVWFIESNTLFTNFECSFRSQRSTMDHVVRLETSVQEAIIQRQHLIAIFFDLEKAYETTWRYGITKNLHNTELKSKLLNFIKAFLLDRKFWVRIGSTLTSIQNQKDGVPKRSIQSVTLFYIKINSVTNCLNSGVDKYLFVDDFCNTSISKHICTAELQQKQIGNDKRLKIPKTKTQSMHFCQLRKMHNNPTLNQDGSEIPVVDQYKFLCVISAKKLSFM